MHYKYLSLVCAHLKIVKSLKYELADSLWQANSHNLFIFFSNGSGYLFTRYTTRMRMFTHQFKSVLCSEILVTKPRILNRRLYKIKTTFIIIRDGN